MSYDLGVWSSSQRLNREDGGPIYVALLETGQSNKVDPLPSMANFVEELTALYPQIDDLPTDEVDDSPWSCGFSNGPAYAIMNMIWPEAERMHKIISLLAQKYDLYLYDPQADTLSPPPKSVEGP